jgi:hypothetical protein
MNQERLKLIVHNLELLVNSLKEEIQEPSVDYNYGEIASYIESDVDEYYVEGEEDV